MSANSRGVAQAKRTSRGVPNSITVLSDNEGVAGAASPFVFPLRVNCTGMRTGVASGKKRAKSATLLFCPERDGPVPCCAKRCSPFLLPNPVRCAQESVVRRRTRLKSAVGLPLFPVRKSCGKPESAVMRREDARPGPQCGTEGLALGE